ncbi:ABC-2 type transport system ATP-binding protein [Stackebrandtia albiflava]|uniref:ABC-2 type transport system ATP-binding protein n=1 Tax=Stackebrandtia albiflava TaxID=406432 RepID=A0A562UYF5_9ACTN|nr:alpha/beta fold hydrolase [Stackebrandtia albiflava]TWJ10670.1 ABC-2 type transport system ATP-binding protein [Stackebrandtia albiflava]
MRVWLRRRRRWVTFGVVIAVVAAAAGAWWWYTEPPPHTTEDLRIEVGTDEPAELDARLYVPDSVPAPAVLLAHGFGGTKESVTESAERLAGRGYVVLTWTARGFGASGGLIHLNAPAYEVADASELLDYLADRDEVERDGDGDPRVAAVGGSYGGALSLLLAGYDDRVDAIVPQITWHSLAESLFPNHADPAGTADDGRGEGVADTGTPPGHDGVFKRAWAGLFYATGLAGAGPPGVSAQGAPALPPACGRWAPDVCAVYQEIAASGRLTPQARELLDASSPASVLSHIEAPTLLIQGQADTLFDLGQAEANAEGIINAPVKVAWYAGGHDAAGTASDQERIDALTVRWLDFHLKGEGDDPGDDFTYSRIGGVTSSRSDLATVGLTRDSYPGLAGTESPLSVRVEQPVTATIASPPDGTPAALSSLPSLGQLATFAGAGFGGDIPGQFAAVETESFDDAVDIVGAPSVSLRAASPTGEAVLFVKLYDVDSSGRATLPNGLIAPVRLTGLPTDIADAEPVTVTLPGIVHRLEPGHHLRIVVATADQSYAGPVEPVEYTIAMPDRVTLPQTTSTPLPSQDGAWQVALVVLLIALPVGAAGAWLVARIRHRRRDRSVDPDTADVPLVVRGLRKVYADGFAAVNGVDYRVERGQVVGLLGPNGAGKTTSLRVLMGLLQPSDGEIRVFGHRVTPGAPVLSRLGALVEGPGLLPHLSGMDNLRLFWRATGRPESEARLDEVVRIADLGERIHRKVRTYSHGMKQRIAIAQAMLGMPELLVLDEPTDGLDPPQIAEMRRVLHDYASDGRAVLVSSHLLAEVEQTCSHVVVMSRGRVVGTGEVKDVIGSGGRLEDAFLELVE